jgi:hypothetical protein
MGTGTRVAGAYRVELSVAGNERVDLDARGAVRACTAVALVHPTS